MHRLHAPTSIALAGLVATAMIGCGDLKRLNTAAVLDVPPKHRDKNLFVQDIKTCYAYPVRDWFEPLLLPQAAWNSDPDGDPPTGSFLADRDPALLTPTRTAAGPCTQPPPQQPFTFKQIRHKDHRLSFFGKDVAGRRFLVKIDRQDYPETASAAEIIATRLVWAMG